MLLIGTGLLLLMLTPFLAFDSNFILFPFFVFEKVRTGRTFCKRELDKSHQEFVREQRKAGGKKFSPTAKKVRGASIFVFLFFYFVLMIWCNQVLFLFLPCWVDKRLFPCVTFALPYF